MLPKFTNTCKNAGIPNFPNVFKIPLKTATVVVLIINGKHILPYKTPRDILSPLNPGANNFKTIG